VLLAIPFFAAAVYTDFGLWALSYTDILSSATNSSFEPLSFLAKAIAFVISVGIVAFSFSALRLLV